MLETLDVGDVSTKGPVHGAAIRADQDPSVHRGPGRVGSTAVGAQRQRVPRLRLVEHYLVHGNLK